MPDPAGEPTAKDAGDLVRLATAVAAEGAALAARMLREGVQVAGTKSSPTDIVTRADQATEELVRERLLVARPGDGFLGEEGHQSSGRTGVRWIVDPIDGTVNYLYGLPFCAVSIAAEVDGTVIAGVVHNIVTGSVYAATLGGGATQDEVSLQVRTPVPLSERLIGTGFGYDVSLRRRQAGYVAAMLPQIRDVRRMGSCALDLCAVASGRLDGYVEEGAHTWDHAAGGLVAREAGATFQVLRGASGMDLVVCAPRSGFAEFFALIEACGFLGNT